MKRAGQSRQPFCAAATSMSVAARAADPSWGSAQVIGTSRRRSQA